ncbi:MAG TPA: hypothetical protein VGF45_12380, partial [Polyangia bacterium]
LKGDFGELTREYEFGPSRVRVTSRLIIKRQRIPRENLPSFNKFLKVLNEQAPIGFGLARAEKAQP